MAATAGQIAEAGRVPNERIATTVETSDSSTFTTSETTIASVTASLVSGRTYRIRFYGSIVSTVADGQVQCRLREDNTSGTQMQGVNVFPANTSSSGHPLPIEAEFTAVSTGNKTFVATGQRVSGTGTINMNGAATNPAYMYCDYIRG